MGRVLDETGRLVLEEELQVLDWPDSAKRKASRGMVLHPGNYRLQLLLDGAEVLEAPMIVPDVGAQTLHFEWQLPT